MSGYRVVYVEPGKPAAEKEIGTKLEDIQEAVGLSNVCIPMGTERFWSVTMKESFWEWKATDGSTMVPSLRGRSS